MNKPEKKERYATRSKYFDLIIFAVLLFVIFATSYRLRVYYQFTYAKVTLVRINPDGERIDVPVPNFIQSYGLAAKQRGIMWNLVEKSIRAYTNKFIDFSNLEQGTKLDWTIRYSYNSFELDKERIISFEVNDKSLNR